MSQAASKTDLPRKPNYSRLLLGIELPEVDRLIEEARKIENPVSSSIGIPRCFTSGGGGDTKDSISGLPSDILQFIISLLTMREGAATSILSTRWRHLWSTSVTRLKLDESNLLGYEYPVNYKIQESERADFITRADHILQSRSRDLKMDTLQVSYLLHGKAAAQINRWMELAAVQGVKKLILDLKYSDNKYRFPVETFGSSLNYLDLTSCLVEFPPDCHGLNSLVSLSLSKCFITMTDVQNVLSNCPLQWLSLVGCRFPERAVFKFGGPSLQLKHLHISDNWQNNIESIKVEDMSQLLSFEVDVGKPKMQIKGVPRLTRLVLYILGPIEILENLPHLETLFLDNDDSGLPKLSTLNNLRQLVFRVDGAKSNLFEVVCFLDACPLLEQLDLYMCGSVDEEIDGLSSRPACTYRNLKEVHMYGFDSHPEIIEFAHYLFRSAIGLEKMILYPTCKSYKGNGVYVLSVESVPLVGMSLEKTRNLFLENSRPNTEVLIM